MSAWTEIFESISDSPFQPSDEMLYWLEELMLHCPQKPPTGVVPTGPIPTINRTSTIGDSEIHCSLDFGVFPECILSVDGRVMQTVSLSASDKRQNVLELWATT